jgi:hypothetical protein
VGREAWDGPRPTVCTLHVACFRGHACGVEPGMRRSKQDTKSNKRCGAATLDYVLLLGVILPLAAFVFRVGPKIIRLAYELVCGLVSWPFM